MLEAGNTAPAFDAAIDGGGTLSSESLAGKPYVIYFYPQGQHAGLHH
jgi:peroxiredoxin Q/BCP